MKEEKIRLLDGSLHNKQELLDNAFSDEFYYGFLGKVALSSSSCKLLLDSPKTYHYVTTYGNPSSQALRDGWLFHTMILEPEKIDECVFVNVQSKNTKAYKEAVQYHDNVFTIKEKQEAERLVDGLLRNEQSKSLIGNAQYEIPAVGLIEDIPFRAKADILKVNGGIIDLKTTVDVSNFHISARKWRYHVQVYIYCTLFEQDWKDFKFLCVDKKNLDIGVFDVSEEFFELGRQDTLRAIEVYQKFFKEDFDLNDYVLTGTL